MTQLGLPSEVSVNEIVRERSLGGAIDLCAKAAGFEGKEVQAELKLDKAQWSRWQDGKEGILWPKLTAVMDHCGNDAPVLWMAHVRGFDIARIPRYETELERENRLLREENRALRRVVQANP